MARIRLTLVLVVLTQLGVPAPARAGQIVMQKQYLLGVDTPSRTIFYVSCDQAPHVGGACFKVPADAARVRFLVEDATRTSPGASIRHLGADGRQLVDPVSICEDTDLAVPDGTDRVQVLVNGPGEGRDACPSVGIGTAGTITATFTIEGGGGGPGYVPSPAEHSVRAERKQYVPSGDTTVQVDVYRPDAAGTFPVLVWFDVYYKDDPGAVVNGERDYFVSRGYVFVHASSPGSNTSGGAYENAFGPAEQQAAYDVVEWAGTQPWSNGKVAMEGLSYAAIIEYFVAARRPPHLVTIYPTSAYSDLYREITHTGGNLQAGYPVVWDVNNRTPAYAPPQSLSADPVTQLSNYATTVAGYRPILADFLLHPNADDFYRVRSPATFNSQTIVPAAIDVGWHDDMVYGGPVNYETLSSSFKRLVIGPWGHSEAHRRPGGRQERLRWFDFHLKGLPSGVDEDPRVRVFVPNGADDGDGTWLNADAWPIPGTAHKAFYLGAGGSLGDHPGDTGSSAYLYSPTRHATAVGDLTGDDEEVRFETAPLSESVTVVGYPELVLHASTDARDTSWNVAVYDVAPSGSAVLLQRGWLRAAARELDEGSVTGRPRHAFDGDEDVPAGEVVEYRIAIWPFANKFPAGHRIRLVVSDATAGPGGAPAFMPPDPGVNTLHYGAGAPSRLLLPVI